MEGFWRITPGRIEIGCALWADVGVFEGGVRCLIDSGAAVVVDVWTTLDQRGLADGMKEGTKRVWFSSASTQYAFGSPSTRR